MGLGVEGIEEVRYRMGWLTLVTVNLDYSSRSINQGSCGESSLECNNNLPK